MSSWSSGQRPLTLAILALGGEGGGVLADWVVAAAEGAGWCAQNTSVAGVAQRTGATVYYVELFPPADAATAASSENGGPAAASTNGAGAGDRAASANVRSEPIMSIFPTPGEVDVVITSELMESGRAIQRGFATPDRTTLITSTSRVYSIDEKMALGDGRVDDRELVGAAERSSRRLIAADFAAMAERAGSVISASLFGALAGSGAVPLTREQFEAPVRAFGSSVEPSLAAFAAGFAAAASAEPASRSEATPDHVGATNGADAEATESMAPDSAGGAPAGLLPVSSWSGPSKAPEHAKVAEEARRTAVAASDPTALVGPALRPLAHRVGALPVAARSTILHGLVRTAVYQDLAYAERYLARVGRFASADPDHDGDARLTDAAARHIAVWMCYQDTIHVALQKTRRGRMERVRREAKAKPDQLLEVREFLHPQIDEITDILPVRIGTALRESVIFGRIVHRVTHKGMILNTTSVVGYTLLTTMARLRPLRPRSLRFVHEQEAIDRWIEHALAAAASDDAELAREIVECQRVLKGYGATMAHGTESFTKLMDAARALAGSDGAAPRLAELRSAALADEDGTALDARLAEQPPVAA